MKMRKAVSFAAALAMVSAMAIPVSAADWSKTGYADDNPDTVKIISTDANGVTFAQTAPEAQAKARITLVDVLENPDDISKIKSGSWTVTYNGLSGLNGTTIGWLGGGTYCATGNSTGFGIGPTATAEDGTVTYEEDSVSVTDDFKYLLPDSVPTDPAKAEFVFMEWSNQDWASKGVTVTISDFKLFDADGNEIPQKAYSGAAASADASAPAADATTTSSGTGNAAAASIAAVMAVAGAAAVASRKRK